MAYLHSTLKEEVYMEQPDGYIKPTGCGDSARVSMAIQAGRTRNEELKTAQCYSPTAKGPAAYASRL